MPNFEAGARTPAPAAGAAYLSFQTPTSKPAYIREIGIATSAATLSSVGLGLASNTPAASSTVNGQNTSDISGSVDSVNIGIAWSTAPTAPTVFLRRFVIPATAGLGFIWRFDPPGLYVPANNTKLVLWNFGAAAAAACDVYVAWTS